MRFKTKEAKGITLIALVITIIVLLILAAVSIITLTGENGILTQAGKAKEETTKAGAREQAKIAVMASYGLDGKLSETTLRSNLSMIEGVSNISEKEGYPITLTIDGVKLKITEDGTVTEEFDAQKWDESATSEDCFLWEDTTIIGLNMDKLSGVEKIIIPSKCTKIRSDYSYSWPNANETYRDFVTGIKIVEIPETVVEIGDYAFLNFRQLEEIKIPNSVKRIGDWSFSWCTSLQEVYIPDSVEYIGNSAFNNSYNIVKVRLSNNLTELKSGIFLSCNKIENIVIPNKVTKIEREAFRLCTSLSTITIPSSITTIGGDAFDNTAWYNNQPDGVVYAGKVLYKYKGTMPNNTSIQIKEGTIGISNSAFSNYKNLSSITIPSSVTNIGEYAFLGCGGLSNITIPSSVINIGYNAFYGWTSSQTINIQGYTSAPSGWDSTWNSGCSATINWGQ